MVFRISLPSHGAYKKNTEDLVVSTLSREFPLTLQQLHTRIKKDYAVTVTYQAIRKTVNNLLNEKILIKEGKTYLINRTWILENATIIEDLKRAYFELKKPKTKTKVGETVTEYSFSNLIEKDRVWCKIEEDWTNHMENDEAKVIAWQGAHNWWLIGQLEHETRFMNEVKKKVKVYQLVNGNTPLDQWSVKYYQKLGIQCALNKDKEADKSNYVVVFGDYIMQTHYPKDVVEKLEHIYKNAKTLDDIDLNEIMSILTSEQNIKVILIKNRNLAKRVREDILSHF